MKMEDLELRYLESIHLEASKARDMSNPLLGKKCMVSRGLEYRKREWKVHKNRLILP